MPRLLLPDDLNVATRIGCDGHAHFAHPTEATGT
jgi:hypothetical protein